MEPQVVWIVVIKTKDPTNISIPTYGKELGNLIYTYSLVLLEW